ncbi:MAG: hypothetical protein H5T86_15685, partial [Armatimonadetes bacterium]|nr:hypothetical protein [Armatimonadota bacterium]
MRSEVLCLAVGEQSGTSDRGVIAKLVLEAVDGSGVIFPDPAAHLFTRLADDFEQAINNATAAAAFPGARPLDVRWRIESLTGEPLPEAFTGPSAGAAFAIALKLLEQAVAHGRPRIADPSIGVTAAISAEGELMPVGGIVEKLLAALNPLAPIAHVIVAEGQPCPANTAGLQILEAQNLDEAFEKYQQTGWIRRVFLERAAAMFSTVPHGTPESERAELEVLYKKLPLDAYQKLDWGKEVPGEESPPEESSQGPDRQRLFAPAEEAEDARERVAGETTQPGPVGKGTTLKVMPFDQAWSGEAGEERAVLRAAAGAGKTTALRYIAYQFATGRRSWAGQPKIPIFVRLPEWARWFRVRQQNGQSGDLVSYLAVACQDYKPYLRQMAGSLG